MQTTAFLSTLCVGGFDIDTDGPVLPARHVLTHLGSFSGSPYQSVLSFIGCRMCTEIGKMVCIPPHRKWSGWARERSASILWTGDVLRYRFREVSMVALSYRSKRSAEGRAEWMGAKCFEYRFHFFLSSSLRLPTARIEDYARLCWTFTMLECVLSRSTFRMVSYAISRLM